MPITAEQFYRTDKKEFEAALCRVEDFLRANPDLAYSAQELLEVVVISPDLMDYVLEELEFTGRIEHGRVRDCIYYRIIKAPEA
jgi:hypothetical protein